MTLRYFTDFSAGLGGDVLDEHGLIDHSQLEMQSLETYTLYGALYVFDYDERLEKLSDKAAFEEGRREIDKICANPFSPMNRIYRIISSSEKKQTAIGVELKNPDKKKTLCNLIKDEIIKDNEREAWEICQGLHREEDFE